MTETEPQSLKLQEIFRFIFIDPDIPVEANHPAPSKVGFAFPGWLAFADFIRHSRAKSGLSAPERQ